MQLPQAFAKICRKYHLKIGFANGCFDLLHQGHINFLNNAKKHCDVLFLGVNSDESIADMKGAGRPFDGIFKRIRKIEKLDIADYIIGFESEDDLARIIKEINPDVFLKSEEYRGKKITGEEYVRRIIFIPRTAGISSSS